MKMNLACLWEPSFFILPVLDIAAFAQYLEPNPQSTAKASGSMVEPWHGAHLEKPAVRKLKPRILERGSQAFTGRLAL